MINKGYCQCGCGRKTNQIKGIPRRFINGHSNCERIRDKNPAYIHGNRVNNQRLPEIDRCYRKLRTAIESGKIKTLPCEICGNPDSMGHHEDYSKPYDVKWLCRKHHYRIHYNI